MDNSDNVRADSATDQIAPSQYDPLALKEKVEQWRAEAERANSDAVRRICLEEADRHDRRLQRSLSTPVLQFDELLEAISQICASTATDPDLKARFIADPEALMSELGVVLPVGMMLEARTGPEDGPAAAILKVSPETEDELTDDALNAVTGGSCGSGWSFEAGLSVYTFG